MDKLVNINTQGTELQVTSYKAIRETRVCNKGVQTGCIATASWDKAATRSEVICTQHVELLLQGACTAGKGSSTVEGRWKSRHGPMIFEKWGEGCLSWTVGAG